MTEDNAIQQVEQENAGTTAPAPPPSWCWVHMPKSPTFSEKQHRHMLQPQPLQRSSFCDYTDRCTSLLQATPAHVAAASAL